MRLFLFLAPVIFFIGCESSTGQNVKEISGDDKKSDPASALACRICILHAKLVEAERLFVVSKASKKDGESHLKTDLDSLKSVMNQLLNEYNGKLNEATTECYSMFQLNHIVNERRRDSLYLEFYEWGSKHYPDYDTAYANNPFIDNGKCVAKYKGEYYLLEPNVYKEWETKTYGLFLKTEEYRKNMRIRLASEITGLPKEKVDEVCLMAVVGGSTNVVHRHYAKQIAPPIKYRGYEGDTVFSKILNDFLTSAPPK